MVGKRAIIAVFFLGLANPAHGQTIGHGVESDIPWIKFVASLLLCFVLAAGAAVAVRARAGGAGLMPGRKFDIRGALAQLSMPWARAPTAVRRLTVVETAWLGNNVSVSLVRCDDREYLVGTTPQGRVFVSEIDPSGTQST